MVKRNVLPAIRDCDHHAALAAADVLASILVRALWALAEFINVRTGGAKLRRSSSSSSTWTRRHRSREDSIRRCGVPQRDQADVLGKEVDFDLEHLGGQRAASIARTFVEQCQERRHRRPSAVSRSSPSHKASFGRLQVHVAHLH